MRVGLIIYGSLDTLTGGYIYDHCLVRHLRANGDDVSVFTLPWRSYPEHLLDNISLCWMKSLARTQLDVLLQDELNHPSLIALNRYLKSRVSFPIVAIVHNLRCRGPFHPVPRSVYRAVERYYLESVDGFIFNSLDTRGCVQDVAGRSSPSVVAYPAGDRLGPPAEERDIAVRASRGGALKLLFVGNLSQIKGLEGLIDALALLRGEPWELTVAGSLTMDPAYAASVRQRIASLGLGGKARFAGQLTGEPLAALYRESDLFAMPFSREGFGIVYLEAMAHGLPVLASRRGGAGEIVIHGETGYLFDPGDVSGVAAILLHLIRNCDELSRLSVAARGRFDDFPTWDDTASRIRAFLRDLTSKRLIKSKFQALASHKTRMEASRGGS